MNTIRTPYEMNASQVHTLAAIATEFAVDKRTVQNWLKAHKTATGEDVGRMMNGARVLTDDEVQVIAAYRKPKAIPSPAPQVIQVIEEPELRTAQIVEYQGGEFDISTAISNLDGALGTSLSQAEQVVATVELICDKVAHGLERKVSKQKQELEAAEDHLNRVEAARKVFRRRTAVAAAESRELAAEQTSTTAEMQTIADSILALGKKPQS